MQTKILVLHKKRLLIGIAAIVAALLLILLITGRSDTSDTPAPSTQHNDLADYYSPDSIYRAGVYTSAVALGDSILNLELVLDESHIKSVRLVNLEESVTTMYPLVAPALDSLAEQLTADVPVSELRLSDDKKYTQSLLVKVIEQTLDKASLESTDTAN